jgi:hypothetical protein
MSQLENNHKLQLLVQYSLHQGFYMLHQFKGQFPLLMIVQNENDIVLNMAEGYENVLDPLTKFIVRENTAFEQVAVAYKAIVRLDEGEQQSAIVVQAWDKTKENGVALCQGFQHNTDDSFIKGEQRLIDYPPAFFEVQPDTNANYEVEKMYYGLLEPKEGEAIEMYICESHNKNPILIYQTIKPIIQRAYSNTVPIFDGTVWFIFVNANLEDEAFLTYLIKDAINTELKKDYVKAWQRSLKKEINIYVKLSEADDAPVFKIQQSIDKDKFSLFN